MCNAASENKYSQIGMSEGSVTAVSCTTFVASKTLKMLVGDKLKET